MKVKMQVTSRHVECLFQVIPNKSSLSVLQLNAVFIDVLGLLMLQDHVLMPCVRVFFLSSAL
jgi:hypothetical protein